MRIPPQAQKVFEGILFDTYQWEQEMYDGSFETFEMIKRGPSVDIIALIDNRIIMLQQEQPNKPLFPGIPGGRVDKGETPLEAAKRELLEETGYTSDEFIFMQEYNQPGKLDFPNFQYIAKNCYKVAEQNLDVGEKIHVTTVSFDEFLQFCRDITFTAPLEFRFEMWEALLDPEKKEQLRKKIFG